MKKNELNNLLNSMHPPKKKGKMSKEQALQKEDIKKKKFKT